jgi:predicted nuclease of predicted toxin-antitoxin system
VRILANENFPRVAVDALRRAGHDVAWVCSDAPGSSDDVVLARALREVRILVTFDKDFEALSAQADWAGQFAIVEPGRLRVRRLN